MRCYDCESVAETLFPVHVCEKHLDYDKYVCKACFKKILKEEKE